MNHQPARIGRRPVTAPPADHCVGIALIDGTPLVREGLSALVHRTPGLRWLGAAGCADTAVQLCERFRPNVVLLDSGLDPRNQLSQLLIGADPAMAIIILIGDQHRSRRYVASALSAGVHGLLLRSAEPPQLVDAIRVVRNGRRYVDAALNSALSAPSGHPANPSGPPQPLSKREYQVLQLIADGLENQAIAKILYVSVETVRTHVKSILRKLSARDRTHAVAVAFRAGVLSTRDSTALR